MKTKCLFLFSFCILLLVAGCKKPIDPNVVIATTAVSNITENTAVSGGTITYDGGADINSRGVCWGTISSPTVNDSKTTDGRGIGTYSSNITDLKPGSTYYVRAYATNANGVTYGNELSFSVSAVVPVVTTSSVSDVTFNSASCGGTIVSDGGSIITASGICWGKQENPTINDSHTTDTAVDGKFTSNMTSLISGDTYYARAYATNSIGTGYGEQVVFQPEANPAVEIADAALKAYLIANFDKDKDGVVRKDEALAVTAIDCSNLGVTSLSGLENFANLAEIRCTGNNISSIDLHDNTTLVSLFCSENASLSSLNLGGCSSLATLEAFKCNLPTINLKGCKALVNLHVFINHIAAIDISDCGELQYFNISENHELESLDVHNSKKLIKLWANQGKYTALDVSGLSSLETLDIQNGAVAHLTVTGCSSLQYLYAQQNAIKVFDLHDLSSLIEFYAFDGKDVIDEVDISGCTNLKVYHIGNNKLSFSELDFSGFANLNFICAWGCGITKLILKDLPALETLNMDVSPSLTSLDLSECPALKTVQLCVSGLTSLDVTKNPKIEFLQVFATSSFKELTMGANPALATLKCQDTNIQTLDVSNCNMNMAEITANPNPSLSTIILREGQVVSNFSYPSTTQLNYVK